MQKVVDWMQSGDKVTFLVLNRCGKCLFADFIMSLITNLGGAIFSIALPIVLLISQDMSIYKVGERLAISLLVSHFIVRLGKKFLPRRRPFIALENVLIGKKIYKDASFPSGHSTAAFCTATVISSVVPALSVVFFILATLVAVSRIYLGLHYPSDITVGAVIGIIVANLFI